MTLNLDDVRKEIDQADHDLISVLARRMALVKQVGEIKSREGTPVYVPERESQLLAKRRAEAELKGLSPDLIEDVLRRVMRESYTAEASAFKCMNPSIKKVVIIGGRGGMGRIFTKFFTNSGYKVEAMGSRDWDRQDEIFKDAGLVIVSVPIDKTEMIIRKLDFLAPDCVLADFTSTKTMPLKTMLEVHQGPVVGLHPMFGPDVSTLAKQLVIWTEGRMDDKCLWLYEQMHLWGANLVRIDAPAHDEAMGYIQALRHFTTFCYGVFLSRDNPSLENIMNLSSPIYRMELMMVGRLFAQDPVLYADIILSNSRNLEIIEKYKNTITAAIDIIKTGDRETFIEEFKNAAAYFGEYADYFMHESKSLLAKMHDARSTLIK